MITIITGLPDSYKSYWLAKKAYEILNNSKETREIWSNFKINDARVHYFEDIIELINKNNIVVFLDEADEELDARDWKDLPKEIRRKFRQHRHHSIDIFMATQDLGFVDITIRKLVACYLEVKKIIGSSQKHGKLPKHPWGLFLVREYHPLEYDKVKRKCLSWSLSWGRKKIYNFYNTHEDISGLINPKDKSNIKMMEVFICPTCNRKSIMNR